MNFTEYFTENLLVSIGWGTSSLQGGINKEIISNVKDQDGSLVTWVKIRTHRQLDTFLEFLKTQSISKLNVLCN